VLSDDFNENIPIPSHVVQSGQEIIIGGIRFEVEDAGLGEASCMMMLYATEYDTLFCADVVQHNMTAFLLEGHLAAWQQQLQRVGAKYSDVRTVYPGHGTQGTARQLFDYQQEYLETFSYLVAPTKTIKAPPVKVERA
jgi:glyoxylase-like metal-dependent hydrolase (beta-lactamase superfamily II)